MFNLWKVNILVSEAKQTRLITYLEEGFLALQYKYYLGLHEFAKLIP